MADDDDDLPETPVKRGRKRANLDAGEGTRKKRKPNAKAAAPEKAAGKKKAAAAPKGRPRKAAPQMANLGSLLGTDVVRDAIATAHLAQQPASFGDTVPGRRDKALAQLIASVPTDDKKAAGADKRFLDAAIKDFTGHASVKPAEDGGWLVNGMRSTLKHYQVMGTAFMRRRENASIEPKGGILADEMGLGKTVMMLANIVNGKPAKATKRRATLIVASPALCNQWAQEIDKHTLSDRENRQHGIGWMRNHAGHRLSTSDNIEAMEKADIVLTTYADVRKSYPKAEVPAQLVTAKQKEEWWEGVYNSERGDFHRVDWLRVVLDEAQAIKNHTSNTSLACRALQAKHYWAISGTPIQNTIAEFYPYFNFIREPHAGSHRLFKENFCTPDDPTGAERLGVYLNKFMIRRTHLDTLFNARLLDLPTPSAHTLWLEFNEVERQIYNIVNKRFIEHINNIAKQGDLEKQYNHIWTMILRLRQICSHCLLVQGTICDLLERSDFEKLNGITANEEENSEEGANMLIHLRNVLKNNKGVKSIQGGIQGTVMSEGEYVPMDLLDAEGSEETVGGMHGVSFQFNKYLKSLKKSGHFEAIMQRSTCSGCKQPPEDPQVTSCWHIYCNRCITSLQHLAARRGHDGARCTECGDAYTSVSPCEGLDAIAATDSPSESAGADTTPARGKNKKKSEKMEDWIGLKGEVLPSAKTRATKAQIQNWLDEDPGARIIIFSQFLPCLKILGKMCVTEGWSWCRYSGDMSHDSREKALAEFAAGKQIMLASLQAGGLGLNLTCASRVICLDPWWNASVEQQAFCRVFRIGQVRECQLVRFVIRNTIDEAMMAMKERKQMEIDEVMADPENKKRNLSVTEMMGLFGEVSEDSSGRPFIFAEEDAERPEHLRVPNLDGEDEMQRFGDED
ncbi:hypothetical protein LTR53_011737 [Teratosphaeriaceae sp. CCFEE 6253]|nr:hypothetical protein LTR53_011737 [Teratosphaeriaceae sp. CCFEE 6253]